jgi:bifunctional non-homologous end joining protein LigD
MSAAISPMLATLGSSADVAEDDDPQVWVYEMKWDGIRAIATVSRGVVRLVTRNGIDVTATYPDLSTIGGQVSEDCVIDGEIVALNGNGRPDFGRLQKRMNLTKKRDIDRAVVETPVHYMVFDILEADGMSVVDREYDDRRTLLAKTVRSEARVHVPPAFVGNFDSAIAASRELGLEGVVAKKRDSTYAAGRRSRAWIKVKHHKTQEVVIGGWRPGKGRRASAVGSLLMGIPAAGGLQYVGRVGTGFDDREIGELTARLAKLETVAGPFIDVPRADASDARWTTPTLVAEVEFAEWTTTDKLRQPSWRGWRPDKDAGDVVRES